MQTVRAIAEAFKKWESAENCTFSLFGISDAGITIHYISYNQKRPEIHYDKGSKFQYFAADMGDIIKDTYRNVLISQPKPFIFCIWLTDLAGCKDYGKFDFAEGLQ